MRNKFLLFALLCSVVLSSCRTEDPLPAAPPGTILFGEEQDEIAADIIEMADGNFLIVGGKEDKKSGEYDIMLIKVDSDGGELWTRILEDESRNAYGRFIRRTTEGYAIIVLESNSLNYGTSNMYLERYTEDFGLIRRTQVTSPDGYYYGGSDPVASFHITSTGSFLVETRTYDRIGIQKFSSDGVPEQPVELANTDNGSRYASVIAPNPAGGYVAAHVPQYNSTSLFLAYFDGDGNQVGTSNAYNLSEPGQVTGVGFLSDSTILVSTYSYSYEGGGAIAQLDLNGTVLQQVGLDNLAYYSSILSDPDGSFHLFGNGLENYTNSGTLQSGYVVLSMESIQGTEQATNFGGTGGDGLRGVIRTSDGRYAMVGYTRSYGAGGSDATLIFYQP